MDFRQLGSKMISANSLASVFIFYALLSFVFAFLVILRRSVKPFTKVEDRLGMEHVSPMSTLREKWQTVAWDGILALLCNVPGFGMLPALWLFIKYSVMQVHLIVEDTGRKNWVSQLLPESIVWANLAMRCVRNVQVYHEHLKRVAAAVYESDSANDHQLVKKELDETFKTMSFDLFGSAILVASTLLWRILNFNMIQIRAHVFYHRKRARENMGEKATRIWQHLSDCHLDGFFDLDEEELDIDRPTVGTSESTQRMENLKNPAWWKKLLDAVAWLKKNWLDVVLVVGSSLTMLFGTLMLHFEHVERRYQKVSALSFSRFSLWLVIGISTFQATLFWKRIVWGVLRRTRHFRVQSNRLLVLAAISTPYLEQTWSKTNLSQLDAMLVEATERSENKENKENKDNKQIGIKINKDEKVWRVEVVKELKLDLTKDVGDITAWWELRSFLQVDCLDKAAIVEFCSIVVVCLLVNFAVVGLMGYMAEHRIVTIGFVLLLLLSGVLIAIMFMLLQACVGTNKLMEASSEGVRVASQQILETETSSVETSETSSTFSMEKKVMLLHVIERRVSSSNDRQHLFGIPVTENLRNGWIVSLVLAFGTSSWKVLGTYVSQLDVAETVAKQVRDWQLAKRLG